MRSITSFIALSALVAPVFTFNNPVIGDANVPDPGVIAYNGVYYAVTSAGYFDDDNFPIHKSSDL